jgi:hypothetical protein
VEHVSCFTRVLPEHVRCTHECGEVRRLRKVRDRVCTLH